MAGEDQGKWRQPVGCSNTCCHYMSRCPPWLWTRMPTDESDQEDIVICACQYTVVINVLLCLFSVEVDFLA